MKNSRSRKNKKSAKKEKVIQEVDEEYVEDSSKKNPSASANEPSNQSSLKLTKIILENFRSYNGKHIIENFSNFNGIIGPNGGGKSSIVEAIYFALSSAKAGFGTQSKKDLVCTSQINASITNVSCRVDLFFDEEGSEISFGKSYDGKSFKYYFNGSKCSAEDYKQNLRDRNINNRLLFFILNQGVIDYYFSSRSLCEMIDTLSGSGDLKSKYEELKKTMEQNSQGISQVNAKLESISAEKQNLKNKIQGQKELADLLDKMNDSCLKIYLYLLAKEDLNITFNETSLEETTTKISSIEEQKSGLLEKLQENDSEIIKREKQQKEEMEKNSELRNTQLSMQNEIKLIDEEYKKTEMEIYTKTSKINQFKEEQKKKASDLNGLEKAKEGIQKEIETTKRILESSEVKDGISSDLMNEYKLILAELQSKVMDLFNSKEKLELELRNLKRQKEDKDKALMKMGVEKDTLVRNIETLRIKGEEMNKKKNEVEKEVNDLKEKHETSAENIKKYEEDYNSKYTALQEAIAIKTNYEEDTEMDKQHTMISELINKNEGSIFGFLHELIIPLQKKLEKPIKVSLLPFLGHLVVDKAQTAQKVSEFLKGKNITFHTLILENIPKYNLNGDLRKDLGTMGSFMVDLIDCKRKEIKSAISFFLKDMIYVNDVQYIRQLKAKGFNTFITLNGTTYRKRSITGGNYDTKKFQLNHQSVPGDQRRTVLEQFQKDVTTLGEELKRFEILKNNEIICENQLKDKLSNKENEFSELNSHINGNESQKENIQRLFDQKTKDIQNTQENINSLNDSINQKENEIISINNDVQVRKNEIFRDFMNRNNLTDLSSFEKISLEKIIQLKREIQQKEEKLSSIESLIKSHTDREGEIQKLDQMVIDLKSKGVELQEKKETINKNINDMEKDFLEIQSTEKRIADEINSIKEEKKVFDDEIEKIGKRLRALVKTKMELEYNIQTGKQNKKNFIIEAKTNPEIIFVKLGEVYEKSTVRFSSFFDIDEFFVNKDYFEEDNIQLDYENKVNEKIFENDEEQENKTIEMFNEKIKNENESLKEDLFELEAHVLNTPSDKEILDELKAKDDEIQKEKDKLNEELKELVENQDETKKEFGQIKDERIKLFKDFYEKFKTDIQEVYTKFTSVNGSPGGSVMTYLSNESEPFSGGVTFLPTPPGKRAVYDIEQLSGGEKTLAVLTLIVSLKKITGAPFIILDEVDVYLDPIHLQVLEGILMELAKEWQLFVISHKRVIYRSAQRLIGTYFNAEKQSSVVLNLNMENGFDGEMEA
ncbi:MAG: chromosome segregation protein SMC [archaeon]|nr:chromosome segregation protein SMC [archaeon]